MTDDLTLPAGVIVLPPEQGRTYDMGFMRAVFKADGDETKGRYCVSEWWMELRNAGPGAHHHEHNDELFYVLEGTASILIRDLWVDVDKGSSPGFPAGVTHDFENRTDERIGLLNFSIPGSFEQNMPAIVELVRAEPIEVLEEPGVVGDVVARRQSSEAYGFIARTLVSSLILLIAQKDTQQDLR